MSGVALTWAKDQKAGGLGPKAVLRALADHANEDHQTWISRSELAAELECDTKTVARGLDELEARGLIVREARMREDGSRASNMITLAVGGLFPVAPEREDVRPSPAPKVGGGRGIAPPPQGHKVPGGGGIKSPGVGELFPGGGGIKSPLTTFEPTLNQQGNQHKNLRAGERADAQRAQRGPDDGWPDDFWPQFQDAYPHLTRMRATLELLRRIRAEGETTFQAILDGVAAYIASKPPERQWLGSDTFLMDRRYEDRPAAYRGRDGPLTGQAGRLAELAESFHDQSRGNSDDPSGNQPSQRPAYGQRARNHGAAGVPWTTGDGKEPPPEILLIAERRSYRR